MVIFHSYVKLPEGNHPLNPIKPPFSYGFPIVFHDNLKYISVPWKSRLAGRHQDAHFISAVLRLEVFQIRNSLSHITSAYLGRPERDQN